VTVTVAACSNGFAVADDGPGIPEAERDRVFAAGYSSVPEGTGIGLHVVSRIAHLHGWAVSVASPDEVDGTRFEITGVDVLD
jgi:signal transduction histidine kinase